MDSFKLLKYVFGLCLSDVSLIFSFSFTREILIAILPWRDTGDGFANLITIRFLMDRKANNIKFKAPTLGWFYDAVESLSLSALLQALPDYKPLKKPEFSVPPAIYACVASNKIHKIHARIESIPSDFKCTLDFFQSLRNFFKFKILDFLRRNSIFRHKCSDFVSLGQAYDVSWKILLLSIRSSCSSRHCLKPIVQNRYTNNLALAGDDNVAKNN